MPPAPPSRRSSASSRSTAVCPVHPRSGDMTFPDFFFQRCTQCKRCTEECPFGALDDDEKGTPKPNPTRCRRCGTCMGACPERIIGFADYNIDSIGSMVKAVACRPKTTTPNHPAHPGPGL
jgi:heterodisulfide reductase subunit A-like polyferredoxin